MNKRGHCPVAQALELLGRVTHTVSDFARREADLTNALSMRNYEVLKEHRNATHEIESAMAARISQEEGAVAIESARVQAIHDQRLNRIRRAHGLAIRTLPKRAQDAKGNRLGEIQMRQLRAERTLESGIRQNEGDFDAIAAALARERAALSHIENQARLSFRGYREFSRALIAGHEGSVSTEAPADFLEDLRKRIATASEHLSLIRRMPIPRLFGAVPLVAFLLLALVAGAVVALVPWSASASYGTGVAAAIILATIFILGRWMGARQGKEQASRTASAILQARRALDACSATADSSRRSRREELQAEYDRTFSDLEKQWTQADSLETDFTNRATEKLGKQLPRLSSKLADSLQRRLQQIRSRTEARIREIRETADAQRRRLDDANRHTTASALEAEKVEWEQLDSAWKLSITPAFDEIRALNAAAAARFPDWSTEFVERWTPPGDFAGATKFAHLAVDLAKPDEGFPPLARLALPVPSKLRIPLFLTYPEQGSLLFQNRESCGGAIMSVLNNVILRLLSTTPPGKLSFTIFDPVGLGENFAGLMHLADFEESIINRRIWTQREHVEERLGELNTHIEKVIQMYLRNDYADITEYNEQAGSVAEKYHFVVVADFPAGISELAAKRLQSIAISGPRCGVFTLIHWDQRQVPPDGFPVDELRKLSVTLRGERDGFVVGREQTEAGAALVLDSPPDPPLALAFIQKVGKHSIDSNRVQVPFSHIAPATTQMWTNDTTNELRVAIGRTGATKLQYLAIGKGTRQHALFAGKTGSGKSTLFHVIITNLALTCSPDQVEFYLIDFKKGVEFKCYATKRLPHARVVAIESDREFALSVLQRLDEELKRRGDLFRKLGVQDLAGYKKAGGSQPMPRTLLLIDEFQEFFVEDDTIAQTAALLFDRIVRQGRAFGIHVLLGSQTLGGAYSLARATLGQMVIRVALQCNEADAHLIMDDGNSAPRLLSRPGEGIYNDAAGAIEGNSPFQVVWLADDERDRFLDKVRTIAEQRNDRHPSAIVFEGNAPADIGENDLLAAAMESVPAVPPSSARCWLGAPNSIKGPTEAVFRRQSGNHLLIVGQQEDAALTIIGLSLLALAAQHPVGSARFIVIHGVAPGAADETLVGKIAQIIPHEVSVASPQEIPDVIKEIASTMKARNGGESSPVEAASVFLFIHGLQKFKKLRQEDDFSFSSGESEASTGAEFNDIICEGSAVGIHIIATVDTLNNVNRSMSRKALSEFEMRVAFQMSANDSASFIDSPRASTLGLHRALLHNEQAGMLETFRPYATPDAAWLDGARRLLAARRLQNAPK